MPQFFETIQAKYGKGGAQFLSDHPNPGNRTEYVNREIATLVPKGHYATNTAEFKRVQRQVSGMHAYTSKEVESGAWKKKDPNQTVSTGVNQYDASVPANAQIDTAPPQQWITFTGNGFTMEVPANWRAAGDRNSAMIAPPGGIASSADGKTANLVYGILTDMYSPDQQGQNGDVFASLVDELARENPGISYGRISNIRIGNIPAESVDAVNRSANGGRGEHDWIVGIRGNQALRYFVFVAPEQDFSAMRPTFEHILNSIRAGSE
jgi:hypothetical protein